MKKFLFALAGILGLTATAPACGVVGFSAFSTVAPTCGAEGFSAFSGAAPAYGTFERSAFFTVFPIVTTQVVVTEVFAERRAVFGRRLGVRPCRR